MTGRPAPPNVLVIVLDQERVDALGAYGSQVCRTPNLDRLAADGVRFETAIVPTALCSPSRASMLTGRYPHGHGILNNTHEPDALRTELSPDIPTYPAALRDAGYRLGFVGKWHVGRVGPAAYGYHDVAAVPEDVAPGPGPVDPSFIGAHPRVLDPVYAEYPHGRLLVSGIDARPIVATETHRQAQAAIDLLEGYGSRAEPFCLSLNFEGPHHPYTPPEPFASAYDAASIQPWPNFAEPVSGKPAAQRRLIDQRGVGGWTWAQWRPVVARYFGYLSFIDAEIGRVLDALDRLDLTRTTVVIHTADHGDMTGSHGGQFNKGPLMYDEIYRVPLIVRDPRAGSGGVCRAPVSTVAIMPTILELAGIARPPGLHAESLLPFVSDPSPDPGDGAAFAEYHGEEWGLYSQRMVRTHGAKYVYSPHGTDELYDLAADPHELHNVAEEPAYAALATELRSRLVEWMSATDDPLAVWARRLY
jgi:arylsulfatase A-like enzyme